MRTVFIKHQEEIIFSECDETWEQVVQRSYGCPTPGIIQGQVGWGFEPGLVENVSTHDRKLELGDLQGPFQPKQLHNSMIHV